MAKKTPEKMNGSYTITIRRQHRRSMLMQVVSGGVMVYIPRWLKPDSPQVNAFVQEGLSKLEDKIPQTRPQITTPDELREMVDHWARKMGLNPTRVTIRDMRRKWGSCSSNGSVTLNAALCVIPRELAEYVVVHELAHLSILNHSKAFWALVEKYLPEYRILKTRIDRESPV